MKQKAAHIVTEIKSRPSCPGCGHPRETCICGHPGE